MRLSSIILGLIVTIPTSCGSRSAHDSVVISMDVGSLSPVEVGVLTPSKKFIFTYSDEFQCQGTIVKTGRVSIEPSNATGYFWNPDGERREVAVFGEVGTHTIYVSNNLETEFENSSTISKKYTNERPIKIATPGSCSQSSEGG